MKEEFEKYHQYLNGEAAEEEVLDKDILKFLEKSAEISLPKFNRSMEDAWARIDELTEEKTDSRHVLWRKWVPVAAAIALLMVSSLVIFNKSDLSIDHNAGLAESKRVLLPDGSKVILNAGSTISFKENWDRSVNLKGEAFFEVVHGSEFTVETANGTVSVLGTSFNVFDRDDQLKVDCKTGKVKVEIPALGIAEILTPGFGVVLSEATANKRKIDTATVGIWTAGEFYFSNQPLKDVFNEIERQFNVSVEADQIVNKRLFSGYFVKSDLNSALQMVCEPLGLGFTVKGSNVTIDMK